MFELEGHLWLVWIHMRERCRDSNHPSWNRYGGRGISVCDEWLDNRVEFYKWANGSGYEKGLHIDRINNDGPYSPDNCRWVTAATNARNKSDNVTITIDKETKVKADWMNDRRVTIGYGTYYKRKAKGWTDKDALFTPPLESMRRARSK